MIVKALELPPESILYKTKKPVAGIVWMILALFLVGVCICFNLAEEFIVIALLILLFTFGNYAVYDQIIIENARICFVRNKFNLIKEIVEVIPISQIKKVKYTPEKWEWKITLFEIIFRTLFNFRGIVKATRERCLLFLMEDGSEQNKPVGYINAKEALEIARIINETKIFK
jgi:hypothetical protein